MLLPMVAAEWLHRRTGDEVLPLARRWATGTAIMAAVGAVSGTVLCSNSDCTGRIL